MTVCSGLNANMPRNYNLNMLLGNVFGVAIWLCFRLDVANNSVKMNK